jgi:long-chain acyl-CoA synthetase
MRSTTMNFCRDVLPPWGDGPMPDFRIQADELQSRASSWTQSAVFARIAPQVTALVSAHGTRTFAELHANANRVAHALRARGLKAGDGVALACSNRPEFVEVMLGALRAGLRLTPVNSRLTAAESAYIVKDCGAKLVFAERGLAVCGLGVAPEVVIGDAAYEEFLAGSEAADLPNAQAGALMLYTSGTTGNPKGVWSGKPDVVPPQYAGSFANYRPGDVQLCAGPAYHAAPMLFDLRWPLASGVPVVMMDKWDAQSMLGLVERYRISHAHMVPTMFQRLLALPPEVRSHADLSSLRCVLHGAAPCSVETKRAMIDWLGPILIEYYAATEGGDGIHVHARDWLERPGTVGRLDRSRGHRILDEHGQEVPAGTVGMVYFQAPADGRFEYFGDPEKTAAAYRDGRFTLGDLGYVDEDGWLFLTGRSADVVISGGVNIYPIEVDTVLSRHPAVADVCTVGVPDAEWGERLVAVVVPREGDAPGPALEQQLLAHAAAHLPGFKRPRQVVFQTQLPRTETGKLLRNRVRAGFWEGLARAI